MYRKRVANRSMLWIKTWIVLWNNYSSFWAGEAVHGVYFYLRRIPSIYRCMSGWLRWACLRLKQKILNWRTYNTVHEITWKNFVFEFKLSNYWCTDMVWYCGNDGTNRWSRVEESVSVAAALAFALVRSPIVEISSWIWINTHNCW